MSCFYPNIIQPPNPGKPDEKWRFSGKAVVSGREIVSDKDGEVVHSRFFTGYKTDPRTGEISEGILVPCGHCAGCKLDRSRMWANRCVLESLNYPEKQCWFITLTYSDDSVHQSEKQPELLTLKKSDVQKFLKDLANYFRYNFDVSGIRHFVGGEYGGKTYRPHYHAILFGLPIPDFVLIGKNFQGDPFYTSEILQKLWSHGFIAISEVNWKTCAYTARYVLKKAYGKDGKALYENAGIESEFQLQSLRPGIGMDYFYGHYDDIYETDEIILPDGNRVKPPRLFDRHMQEIDPDRLAEVKEKRRKVAEIKHDVQMSKTDLDETEYLKVQEFYCNEKLKKLFRKFQDYVG